MEYELSEVTIGFNLVCLDHCLWRVRAGPEFEDAKSGLADLAELARHVAGVLFDSPADHFLSQ